VVGGEVTTAARDAVAAVVTLQAKAPLFACDGEAVMGITIFARVVVALVAMVYWQSRRG
jgi:hypothetical protein